MNESIRKMSEDAPAGVACRFVRAPLSEELPQALRLWKLAADESGLLEFNAVKSDEKVQEVEEVEKAGKADAEVIARSRAAEHLDEAVQRLERWWRGDRTALEGIDALFSKNLPGSDFEKRVWAATRAIEPAKCASYGDIAKKIGVSGGAQAVGNALRKNPLILLTPCHRVLPAEALAKVERAKRTGDLSFSDVGGFSGATSGPLTDLKRALLVWEAEHFGDRMPSLF